jgi:predicted Fe-Mo cluster-binding NifX family protein
MQQTVALVSDCDAVLVARIGPGAVESLAEHGIRAFIIADRIEAALNRVVASGLLVGRTAWSGPERSSP